MKNKKRGMNPFGDFEPNDRKEMAENVRLALGSPDAILIGDVLTGLSNGKKFVATFDGHGFFIKWEGDVSDMASLD